MRNKDKMAEEINGLLKLDRPLVFFDLETTGLAMNMDKIIELAYVKVFPGDGLIQKDDIFINPEIPISKESSAIHGIKDEDVAMMPTFKEKAQDIYEIFKNCYYSGFNVNGFDLPFLKREFLRVGIDFEYTNDDIVDAKQIFHYMEPRTLTAAYKFYCEKELVDAHSAIADVEATVEVFISQLKKYSEVRDWEFIKKIHSADLEKFVDNDRKFYWRDGVAHFAFSKHKDKKLEEVAATEPGFLNWIIQSDFSDETKEIVMKALKGEFPKKNISIDKEINS